MRIALSKAKVTMPSGQTIEQVAVVSRDQGVVEVRDRTGTLVASLNVDTVNRTTGDQWVLTLTDLSTVTVDRMIGGGCGCGR